MGRIEPITNSQCEIITKDGKKRGEANNTGTIGHWISKKRKKNKKMISLSMYLFLSVYLLPIFIIFYLLLFFITLHYTTLHYTTLHCISLHNIAFIILYYIKLYYITLHFLILILISLLSIFNPISYLGWVFLSQLYFAFRFKAI